VIGRDRERRGLHFGGADGGRVERHGAQHARRYLARQERLERRDLLAGPGQDDALRRDLAQQALQVPRDGGGVPVPLLEEPVMVVALAIGASRRSP
jgi:hypothetical protein